jgi:hypothetical protein
MVPMALPVLMAPMALPVQPAQLGLLAHKESRIHPLPSQSLVQFVMTELATSIRPYTMSIPTKQRLN